MRWLGGRESDNVDDRRGSSGGGGGLLVGGGVGSVVIAIIYFLLGGNPSDVLNTQTTNTQSATQQAPDGPQADDAAASFTRKVLASTEDVWTKIFADQGAQYTKPTLVMYRGVTSSGCGTAQEAMGPFYCRSTRRCT